MDAAPDPIGGCTRAHPREFALAIVGITFIPGVVAYHRRFYTLPSIRSACANRTKVIRVTHRRSVYATRIRIAGVGGAAIAIVAIDGVFRNTVTIRIAFSDRTGIAIGVAEGLAILAFAPVIAVSEV